MKILQTTTSSSSEDEYFEINDAFTDRKGMEVAVISTLGAEMDNVELVAQENSRQVCLFFPRLKIVREKQAQKAVIKLEKATMILLFKVVR